MILPVLLADMGYYCHLIKDWRIRRDYKYVESVWVASSVSLRRSTSNPCLMLFIDLEASVYGP